MSGCLSGDTVLRPLSRTQVFGQTGGTLNWADRMRNFTQSQAEVKLNVQKELLVKQLEREVHLVGVCEVHFGGPCSKSTTFSTGEYAKHALAASSCLQQLFGFMIFV